MAMDNRVILDFLMAAGVDYNLQYEKYWGVAFLPGKAVATSSYFNIEVDGDIVGESPFYSYYEKQWLPQSQYPYAIEQILEIAHAGIEDNQFRMLVPYTNFMNFLDNVPEKDKSRCRIIFSQSKPVEAGEYLMKFETVGGVRQYKHPEINKVFMIAPNSRVNPVYIDSKSFYRCVIVNESQDAFFVDVIEKYGRVRAGILHSPEGYLPDNIDAINYLDGFQPNYVFPINQLGFDDSNSVMSPIHVDLKLLNVLFRTFGLTSSNFISIEFNKDPNAPIFMKNLKENDAQPQVTIKVGSLNPYAGGQRR